MGYPRLAGHTHELRAIWALLKATGFAEAMTGAGCASGESLPRTGVPKLSDSESSANRTECPEPLRTLRGVCDALLCSGDGCSRAAAARAA